MTTREVELTGGAPWGFRMHGGVDQNQPLRISRSYSYPERALNVNPGRKASLSGIREGDVISSINGQPTKTMSNADAHSMLRSAGPVLRLGLNEDKEMSPRRRSFGRASELKRPSHLLSDKHNDVAIPQAPVYATIRPANTSQHRPPQPHPQPPSSLSSLPAALNSTNPVKSVPPKEEPFQFHPTNPFYTTLPSNYSSASKLPVPNGRASLSGLDRNRLQNKFKDNLIQNDHDSDLRSPSYYSLMNDSGPHSTIFTNYNDTGNTNGYNSETLKLPRNNKDSPFVRDSNLKIHDPCSEMKLSEKNPFKMKRNSDPFDKFLRANGKNDENLKIENNTIPISISDSDLHKNEKEINHISVTEHKVSETEEIKTIKKIVMNGSRDSNTQNDHDTMFQNMKVDSKKINHKLDEEKHSARERYIKVQYSPKNEHSNGKSTTNSNNYEASYDKYRKESNNSTTENQTREELSNVFSPVDTSSSKSVVTKPPLKSPSAPVAPVAPAAPNLLPKQTVMIAPTFRARSTSPAVWRPGARAQSVSPVSPGGAGAAPSSAPPPPPPPPVWSPAASPQAPRKTFRPVHFEDTPPSRRKFASTEQNGCTSGSESEGRLRTSHSAPATGLSALGGTSRLPRVQNPTVTLLQKARENHLSRASNIHERDPRLPRDRPSPPIGDPVHALRKGYLSEGEADRRDYALSGSHKMADANRKVEGIGPTTKEGMPVALRSEVKDPSRWYKKMYDTIHKNKYDDDYVTIRYKNRQGQPPLRVSSSRSQYAYFDPRSGYLSEPEGGLSRLSSACDAYDSDVTTSHRRRTASVQEDRRDDAFSYLPNNKYSTLASARASQEVYKSQPGRIENYVPGKSSVVDKEAKQWWDEVMDIFDGQNISSITSLPQSSPKEKKDVTSTILSKSNMARALKESGYESDSTLIFRRREETDAPLSPAERRAAYKDLQAGGEPPLRGFRSPAPPRQENESAPEPPRRVPHGSYSDTESPSRRYVEGDVNIHYRCPVRREPLPLVPERELARHQAEHMKRLYRDQKRHKYLQELQDMQNRRHQDNFMPSQKTVVPLNRYDEAEKLVARALYAFSGQTTRELTFKKGDLINVRRQIDSNWYEGEVHGRIGLFPYNYVEILKGDYAHSPKKPVVVEGQARAKFDFTAQTNLELPLKKGEVVVLTRRIDHNWWEGKNGTKTGIFPDSYVTVLQEPSQSEPPTQSSSNVEKPAASPAAHGLVNGAARRTLQQHSYTPQHNSPALANAPPATAPLPGYVAKPAHATLAPSERGYGASPASDLNNAEPLYVDTNAEAVPYRAMYKYRPQNPDELELQEGDTVYVLEKCDDGWYVGSSQRTGRFGTFPGNYVERI